MIREVNHGSTQTYSSWNVRGARLADENGRCLSAAARIFLAAGARRRAGGDGRARTGDPLLAKQVLSQLSYIPVGRVVGLSGFEPETSRLSAVRSHQLS